MLINRAGMDKMQKTMTVYVKSLSKRAEGDDKEKSLPGGNLGSSMVTHGEDFEPDSEYGTCLNSECSPSITISSPHTDCAQILAEQTSVWLVFKRHMWWALLGHGWRAWSALWHK